MILARSQAQADQGTRVGDRLALPAMVRLVTPHGLFACLVPRAGRIPAQIMLANQRFLNGLRPFAIDFLLPTCARRFLFRRPLSGGAVIFAGRLLCSGTGVVLGRARPRLFLSSGRFFLRGIASRVLTETGRRQRHRRHDHDADGTEPCFPDWNPALKHLRLTLDSRRHRFQKTKRPTRCRHCDHLPRSWSTVPATVGLNQVTEVCLRRRSRRPFETSRAAAPGTQHPGRSSGSIRCEQDLLRCSRVAC